MLAASCGGCETKGTTASTARSGAISPERYRWSSSVSSRSEVVAPWSLIAVLVLSESTTKCGPPTLEGQGSGGPEGRQKTEGVRRIRQWGRFLAPGLPLRHDHGLPVVGESRGVLLAERGVFR